MAAGKEVEKVDNGRRRLCDYGLDAIFDCSDEDNDARDMGPVRDSGSSKGNDSRVHASTFLN